MIRPSAIAALAVAAAAAVPVVPDAFAAETRPVVTVYSQDLGFVHEWRTLTLGAAHDTVRIADIPERIDVASVRLKPGAGRVGRLAYRYDVATGDGLLDRARGSRVRVTLRGDRAVEGTLLSSDGSWTVVREADGSLRSLSRTAIEDARFTDAPKRLFTRPMLEAVIDGGRKGDVTAELSYLTGGLSWSAEHTLVRTAETSGSWESAVTVDNQTGKDFPGVVLKLIAGEPQRALPPPMPITRMSVMNEGAVGKAQLGEEAFADYHLYTLDRPATLRDRETQTLTLLETRTVQFTPRYLFRGSEGRGVRTQIELRNEKQKGLGEPLPAGRVRMFSPDAAGDLQFTGETSIGHTADGEKLTLDVGQAFDLVAERRETANRRISDHERETSVEIKLRNRKKVPVTIVCEETTIGDTEITAQSQPFVRKDANTIQFTVPIAASKEAIVTYTAHLRY
jgi:hypothetical protein